MKLPHVKYPTAKESIRIFFLLLILQLPSLAPIIKYVHVNLYVLIPCYMMSAGFFYHYLFTTHEKTAYIQKLLDVRVTVLILLTLLVVVDIILYRYELSLQALGRGSDAGEALIIAGKNLLHGVYPYSILTHLSNPISPGPGWVIFTMLFTCTRIYELFAPILIIISVMVIQKITCSRYKANLYLLCLLSSPAFWQALVTGNDYISIGIIYSLITIAFFYGWKKGYLCRICLIVGVGMLATARLNFWYLGPLLGFFLWKRKPSEGIYFALSSLFVTVVLHSIFFIWNPHCYSPLHVIDDKGSAILNTCGVAVLLAICIIGGFIARLTLRDTLASWLFLLWLCLTLPLLVLAVFTLNQTHWDINGDGLSYITLTMPIFVMWMISKNTY